MDAIAVGFLVIFAVGFSVWFGLSFTRSFRNRQLASYARLVRLSIPGELEAQIGQRVVLLERSTAAGGSAGALIGIGVLWMLPKPDYTTNAPVDVGMGGALATILLSLMVARCVAATSLTMRNQPGRRVARGTTPRLIDYVPRIELVGVALALIAATAIFMLSRFLVWAGVLHSDELDTPSALFGSMTAMVTYLAVAAALLACVMTPIVLRAPQRAGSKQELAWDDAVRAITLRSMVGLPIMLSFQSLYYNLFELTLGANWHPDVFGIITPFVFTGIATVAAILVIIDKRRSPAVHFQQRLWRDAELVTR